MSNSLKALRRIDSSITDLLTKFCWWSDIHFGKNNVWWANTTFIFLYPILDTLAIFFIDGKKEGTVWYFFGTCFALGLVWYTANRFSFVKTIISNATKSPNKNKESIAIMAFKIASVNIFFILQLVGNPTTSFQSSTSNNLIFSITIFTFLYLLCTEPIPPAVKRKKLEEKGLRTLEHQLQSNRQYK